MPSDSGIVFVANTSHRREKETLQLRDIAISEANASLRTPPADIDRRRYEFD